MFIRPALDPASETEGARLKVRDPVTMAFLAEDGEEKLASDYWLRRQAEGGVEVQVDGKWPLPPADDTLKFSPGTGVEMVEVKPSPDGVAVLEGGTIASVAFMLTAADRIALAGLGYSGEAIAQMTPEEGKKLVADGTPASAPAVHEGPA